MLQFNNKNNCNYFVSSLVYSNIASLLAKYDELIAFISCNNPSFVLLAETWLSPSIPDSFVSVPNFTLFRSDRINRLGGGVCIYVSDQILSEFSVTPINVNTFGIDSLFLKVSDKNVTFVLGCVYRPPRPVLLADDNNLFSSLSQLAFTHNTFFVFGDFNMPDIAWPLNMSQHFSPSSQLLIDLLVNSNLNQLVNEPTRYRLNQRPSTLDLILTSDDTSLANLNYLNPFGKSDHLTLKLDLQLCFVARSKTVTLQKRIVDFKKADEYLSTVDWATLLNHPSVDTNWESFKNHLKLATDKYSYTITYKASSSKPWIDNKILKLIKKKRSLWRTFKRTGKEDDYKVHRAFSNRVSSIIKDVKHKYEKRIADQKNPKKFYSYIRNKLSGPVRKPQVKDATGHIIEDDCVTANIFAETFAQSFTIEPDADIPNLLTTHNFDCLSGICFSYDLIKDKLHKLDTTKSPGPDGISAKILKECGSSLARPLCMLMKQSFRSGRLPNDWKTATITPVFKKGDKFNAANYRPISLTSVVVKLIECIIYDQLVAFLTVIPREQHGFTPGKSIATNLLCCLDNWTRELDSGGSVDIAYFDFSKAFDRVPKRRLLLKLRHYGIQDSLLRWIESFLSDRIFKVKVGDMFSSPFPVLSGVPQGSVLGPLLFLAYVSDIKDCLISPWAMYADDLKIYNICSNYEVLTKDIATIYNWSLKWLLPINADKCNILYLGSDNPKQTYYINGTELTKCVSLSDMGVIVTSTLTWSEHITKVVKKANKILYLLGKTFAKADVNTVTKLYKTYVRPILEYANCVWVPTLQRDINLLESVQRRATRIPYGQVRPSYPDRLNLMKLPSLADRRVRGDMLTTFQAFTNISSPIRHLFPVNIDGRTRGHRFKLEKDNFRTSIRQTFVTNRVFTEWNALPPEVVESASVPRFKVNYDTFRNRR
ncbi:hypothetical protein Zmor_023534 [Zophobas morio]|uniref:Reverse transcriptase domain-containing protein n=1 Tax=Zophobas morio TaxID=2755281 RepID=A0AA38HY67_9CUCU|nr:hypothetical protein Zmor_023534 [Zophobas morio]